MIDYHASIETTITELNHAQKVVAKVNVRQIRGAQQRDLLKATALSWFQSHRSELAGTVTPEALATIDAPYKAILDATDKHAATQTYVTAIRQAKRALIDARDNILVTPSKVVTEDAAPSFGALAADSQMQDILARRWAECICCLHAGAPLAATVMMGGLLEALLVSRANRLRDKALLFRCKATPKDAKTKKAFDLRQWRLVSYIDVGYELGWISRSAKDVAAVLRDYRNYIHPEKERAYAIALSTDDAAMMWEITKNLSRELLSMKGPT